MLPCKAESAVFIPRIAPWSSEALPMRNQALGLRCGSIIDWYVNSTRFPSDEARMFPPAAFDCFTDNAQQLPQGL